MQSLIELSRRKTIDCVAADAVYSEPFSANSLLIEKNTGMEFVLWKTVEGGVIGNEQSPITPPLMP
jgi:hypothetical protein